jgi:hypothetical protein
MLFLPVARKDNVQICSSTNLESIFSLGKSTSHLAFGSGLVVVSMPMSWNLTCTYGLIWQVMHSQTTEFTMETMDIDHNAKMLLSLSTHPRDSGFVIALHSLAGESFFNYKVSHERLSLASMSYPKENG